MLIARPLLREHGIASLLLENPLYGKRKPEGQRRSNLRHVFDLYLMGIAIQFEAVALLNWLQRHRWGPFGIAGACDRRRSGHGPRGGGGRVPPRAPLTKAAWGRRAAAFVNLPSLA